MDFISDAKNRRMNMPLEGIEQPEILAGALC